MATTGDPRDRAAGSGDRRYDTNQETRGADGFRDRGPAAAGAHPDVRLFEAHRGLLFSIAYRMLGSPTEAEDVVQDAWLRYASAPPQVLRSPRAWLGTIVTRLCLDRLKAARTTKEQYVGPWLPEPMLDADREPSLARAVERRESITLAFLVLLESLTPQERAVFLLREVFDFEYRDIADSLDLTPANCRQIFHRAKARLTEHRPPVRPAGVKHQQLVRAFIDAVSRGDLDELRALLAEDVVLRADGGGKIAAALQPLHGRDVVARFLIGVQEKQRAMAEAKGQTAPWTLTIDRVNGAAAIVVVMADGTIDSVVSLATTSDGIVSVDHVRNPDKLAYIRRQIDAQAAAAAADSHGPEPMD